MNLLRQTSIKDLISTLQSLQSGISGNGTSIANINGPVTTPGSLLYTQKEAEDYADTLFGDIDLSQVTANQNDIATLNGDNTVDGSVAKSVNDVATPIQAAIDSNYADTTSLVADVQSGIDILNGDATVDGSVDKKIADLINGAPAQYDTLGEIGDALDNTNDAVAALVSTIASNKTYAHNQDAEINANIRSVVETTIPNEIANTTAVFDQHVSDAAANLTASSDAKYFQVSKLLSELDTADKKSQMRGNLGTVSTDEMKTFVADNRDTFLNEALEVTDNSITLGGNSTANVTITPAHIQHIRIEYANNEYDELVIRPVSSGVVEIYDATPNDLDGITVTAKYVSPAIIA